MLKPPARLASAWRQLVGAVVGGTLALGLYYAYEYGAPALTALLNLPQTKYSIEGGAIAQKDLSAKQSERLSSRARNFVDRFGLEPAAPEAAPPLPAGWDEVGLESAEYESFGDDTWVEDVPAPIPSPLAAANIPSQSYATEVAAVAHLPNSGFGAWALALVAFGLATLGKYQKQLIFWRQK